MTLQSLLSGRNGSIMSQSEFSSRIKEVLGSVFGPVNSDLPPESLIRELEGWDSLKHLSFVLALEEEFEIEMLPEEIEGLSSLRDIEKVIEKHRA